jgi:hypothetical protein
MEAGAPVVSTNPSALLLANVQLLGSYAPCKPNTVAALALEAAARVRLTVVTVIAVYDRNDSNNFGDLVAMALEIN